MDLPERKRMRLKEYDYSLPGAYFVTMCTQNRSCIFELENVGNDLCVVPPEQNKIVHRWIKEAENKYGIKVDKYVIMPNHIHLIVVIAERHAGRSLQDIMQWIKTMTTNEYMKKVKDGVLEPFDRKLWQKSYYDHIIRNEYDYREIWEYIDTNPLKWEEDCFYDAKN